MKADTTTSPRYCEAINTAGGICPPTRTTVAAGTHRPATLTSFIAGTCRARGPRTTIACGVSANHVTVCKIRKASATTLITMTTGDAAQFMKSW